MKPEQLEGFFLGWNKAPSVEKHYTILKNSYRIWLAMDEQRCVGFINAISDEVFYSFIPLLEVLPEYQSQGIGSELLLRMIDSLDGMYAIDLICDGNLYEFYSSKNFHRCVGMVKRNY